jgi:hypothetical protein
MKNLKNLTEISDFIEEVLGKDAASIFNDNLDEYVYYARSEALKNFDITERSMKLTLKKIAEGIVAASVKKFLNDRYADQNGEVQLNVGDAGVFDKNMNPIPEITKIRETQKEILSLIVSRGMYEFVKGRHLAKGMTSRAKRRQATPGGQLKAYCSGENPEQVEVEIMRLEKLLPNLDQDQGKKLVGLYSKLREIKACQ